MRLGSRYLIRSWALPILLAGVALAFDAADRRVPFSLLASGALDEGAHLATGALGLLALSCFIDVPRHLFLYGRSHRVRGHRSGSHTYVPRGGEPVRAACHAFPRHRGRGGRGGGGQPPASGRAGRRGGRAADPFRPGYRRGPARGADALAASGHGLDGQCPVVLGHDRRVHGRAADPGNPGYPPHAYPPVSGARSGQVSSSPPIGRATPGDGDPEIEMAGLDRAGADESSRT